MIFIMLASALCAATKFSLSSAHNHDTQLNKHFRKKSCKGESYVSFALGGVKAEKRVGSVACRALIKSREIHRNEESQTIEVSHSKWLNVNEGWNSAATAKWSLNVGIIASHNRKLWMPNQPHWWDCQFLLFCLLRNVLSWLKECLLQSPTIRSSPRLSSLFQKLSKFKLISPPIYRNISGLSKRAPW